MNMKAIVNTTICGLLAQPTRESSLEDEALYGMVVDILEEPAPGWYRIRTPYRYEGIVSADDLIVGDEAAAIWEASPKMVVRNKNFCDVLSHPKVQGWHLQSLTRGGAVCLLEDLENGWQRVRLADGREGYVQSGIMAPQCTAPVSTEEETLRKALCDAAMLYHGTHYRWGGKTPMGIDCSGLCSMAYMLCGILIYRDAKIMDGFPIHEIPLEQVKPGDLLFFPGHVAMYLGEGRYIHSTGRKGTDGVCINSLIPDTPGYRADLREHLLQAGSIF